MSARNSHERKQERKKLKAEIHKQLQVQAIEVIDFLKEMPWLHRLGLSIWLLFLPKTWMIDTLKKLTSKSESSSSSPPSEHGSSGLSKQEPVPKASPTVSSAGEESSDPSRPSDPASVGTRIEDARNSKLCKVGKLK